MNRKQQSILTPFKIDGIGIHSGKAVTMVVNPAPENTGICFIRLDMNNYQIKANIHSVKPANRATILEENGVLLQTPEHFLAACAGLNIDNLFIELNSEELPICDGSAKTFTEAFIKTGLQEQAANKRVIEITEPHITSVDNAKLIGLPYAGSKYTMVIEYPNSFIGTEIFSFEKGIDNFTLELAPSRTYGFEAEVKALLDQGLAKGGSFDNAVVIGEDGYLNKVRFDNECVRHKCLDLIGDLALLERDIKGHLIGIASGHALNNQFAKEILKKF